MLQEWFFVIGDDGVSANLFQSVIDAVQVAPTIVDDCNGMIVHGNPFPRLDSAASYRAPLLLMMPWTRGSMATASERARPKPLKMASSI